MGLIKKMTRVVIIGAVGVGTLLGVSRLLLSTGTPAHAGIYWEGTTGMPHTALDTAFHDLGLDAFHGGEATINGCRSQCVAMFARQDVPTLLGQLGERLAYLGDENLTIGHGQNAGFFTAKIGDILYILMLIRDHNIGRTLVYALEAPKELIAGQRASDADVGGIDPMPDLRPSASQRVFCLETGTVGLAVYRSMSQNLQDFYEAGLGVAGTRAVSIMAGVGRPLPNNGNLVFFERGVCEGFVTYQSDPEEGCTYAMVCSKIR